MSQLIKHVNTQDKNLSFVGPIKLEISINNSGELALSIIKDSITTYNSAMNKKLVFNDIQRIYDTYIKLGIDINSPWTLPSQKIKYCGRKFNIKAYLPDLGAISVRQPDGHVLLIDLFDKKIIW